MNKFTLPNLDKEKTTLKTIWIKNSTIDKLEEIVANSDISMNRLINECIEFALSNIEFSDND